jgi:hypothetical protein
MSPVVVSRFSTVIDETRPVTLFAFQGARAFSSAMAWAPGGSGSSHPVRSPGPVAALPLTPAALSAGCAAGEAEAAGAPVSTSLHPAAARAARAHAPAARVLTCR